MAVVFDKDDWPSFAMLDSLYKITIPVTPFSNSPPAFRYLCCKKTVANMREMTQSLDCGFSIV